jgi:hypothetical protein
MRKTHVVDSTDTGHRYKNHQLAHDFSVGWSVGRSARWSTERATGWKNAMRFFPVTHRSRISSLESLNHAELNSKPSQNFNYTYPV